MRRAAPPESTFQSHLRAALNAPMRETRVQRQNAGKILDRDGEGRIRGAFTAAPKGAGDLAGFVAPEGLHLEVEVKVDEHWSDAQRAWGAHVQAFGGVYVVVRWDHSLDLEANVAAGVDRIDCAISHRRRIGAGVLLPDHGALE